MPAFGRTRGPKQSDSSTTLRMAAEAVRRIMRADTASVAAFSPATGEVTWAGLVGFKSSEADSGKRASVPLTGELSQKAMAATDVTVILGIEGKATSRKREFRFHADEGLRDLALVPLIARGEKLGLIIVGYRTAHRFTSEEKEMMESLAEMTAMALDNARLLQTVSSGKRIWEQTFDAIPGGIIVHDESMKIVRCNIHAAEMMLMEPAEVVGLSCSQAFTQLFGERAAAFHLGEPSGVASSFELQTGDAKRYLVSVAPLAEGDRHGSVVTWSDVTQLADMQEELSRSRRLATVGQLAAGVAHEINNPLATITTCAEATLRDLQERPGSPGEGRNNDWTFYLEEIVRQALGCKKITRGLLDLSHQRRVIPAPCDINELATQCARWVEQRCSGVDVGVTVELGDNIADIATDEGMVRQVVDNLLSNALDAVGNRGRINISTVREGGRVAIEINDTGAGIAPEQMVRIFEPFFTTKDPGKGSGLGLAISYSIAESLGGAITVSSKQGEGSQFRLWLPYRLPRTSVQSASRLQNK